MDGCERIEAFFSGQAYEPHRNDTYAIGRTISSVQRFHYRGQVRDGVPGGVSDDPRLLKAIDGMVAHMSEQMERLQYDDAVYDLAQALQAADPRPGAPYIATPD